MAIETPFNLNTTDTVDDSIQCSVCGQPNIFGQLCDTCKARLAELETADEQTRQLYLAMGMRCVNTEFRQEAGE